MLGYKLILRWSLLTMTQVIYWSYLQAPGTAFWQEHKLLSQPASPPTLFPTHLPEEFSDLDTFLFYSMGFEICFNAVVVRSEIMWVKHLT